MRVFRNKRAMTKVKKAHHLTTELLQLELPLDSDAKWFS